jgi:RNA polymerase primary sigma factor
MECPQAHQEIIDELYLLYQRKGFIRETEALDRMTVHNVSLTDIERLTSKLLGLGVIISNDNDISSDDVLDYALVDFNKIYEAIIKSDKDLSYIVNYVKNIKPPQWREFDNLFPNAKNWNSYARNRIIEMNLRTALKYALYFHNKYDSELVEDIGHSFIGLILGFEKYNIDKSLKFQNHIQWWIRQQLYREVSIGNRFLRYPLHIKEKLFKISGLFYKKDENHIISNKQNIITRIRHILNCSPKYAKHYFNCFCNYISIETIDLEEEQSLKYDLYDDLDFSITNSYLRERINEILTTLPHREQTVIQLRFGLNGNKIQTLDEIGEKSGVTRERIRQIEAKALRRLRHPKRCKHLKQFFDYTVSDPSDKDLPKNQKFLEK